jgi:hypothetical protein
MVVELKAVHLQHPLLGCPAMAEFADYYLVNGRNVGMVLQFPDGHRASLTYAEIESLQGADHVPDSHDS